MGLPEISRLTLTGMIKGKTVIQWSAMVSTVLEELHMTANAYSLEANIWHIQEKKSTELLALICKYFVFVIELNLYLYFRCVVLILTPYTKFTAISYQWLSHYTPHNEVVGGILVSHRPSLRLSDAGRSMVLLEDQLCWRQSTGLDGIYRSRKITAGRWLNKYVRAECGASSFTWYLYQICNTDVRPSCIPCPLSSA